MFYGFSGLPAVFRPRRESLPSFPVGSRSVGVSLSLMLGLPDETEMALFRVELEADLEAPEWWLIGRVK